MTAQPEPDALTDLSKAAHEAVDRIIASYRNLGAGPVLQPASSAELSHISSIVPPKAGPHAIADVLREACEDIYPFRMPMNHPRAMAFIPAPVSPLSWLGDVLVAGHNAFAGSWYQSPGPSAVEKELIAWLAEQVGFNRDEAGGLFVSGGSIANLTPLVAARDVKLGMQQEDRSNGVAYVSAQTHSSVSKALRIAGLVDQQIKKIRCDESFRMDGAELRTQIEYDVESGLKPFVVIASLATTNTGSIDDLSAIADIAKEFGLWMHVDGAYGASVVLSKTHRHLAKGLEKADSLSWDAHKWLFQTYDTGIVLVKDRNVLLRSFVNNAEYLRDAMATTEQPNFWNLGPELTRPARAIKLWLTLRTLGTEAMGQMIDKGFENAEAAQKRLGQLPDWKVVSPAQMAIVVFKYAPSGLDMSSVDTINEEISKKAIASNTACILTTQIGGQTVLRIVTIHPDLEPREMENIIDRLDEIARDLAQNEINTKFDVQIEQAFTNVDLNLKDAA